MREAVKNLRKCNCSTVGDQPGYYFWWFKETCVKKILAPLPNIDYGRLISDGNGFVKLYVGIASKEPLRKRALWHICQEHSASCVNHGTLSTLRQTLSALLGINMTQSEQMVNDFMDKYCEWEWHPTDTGAEAEAIEKEELFRNYFPLNIKDNKVVDPETINRLKELRKEHKQ